MVFIKGSQYGTDLFVFIDSYDNSAVFNHIERGNIELQRGYAGVFLRVYCKNKEEKTKPRGFFHSVDRTVILCSGHMDRAGTDGGTF